MNTTMRASTMVPSTSQTFSSVRRIATPLPVAHMRVSPVSRQAVKVFARTTKEKGTNAAKNNESGFTLNPRGKGYDSSAREAPNPLPAFTRRREIWTGRVAMVGFASNVIAELFTGVGALGQIRIYTGLQQGTVDNLALAFVLFNFFTALSPGSDTFSEENQQDVRKRPTGPTQNPKINAVSDPKKFFGITNFGFTKKNELFVGRWAMLGFAAALIGEKLTSKGPLGQLGIPFDAPVNPVVASIGLAAWVGFFLIAAIGFGNYGQTEGDEGIY